MNKYYTATTKSGRRIIPVIAKNEVEAIKKIDAALRNDAALYSAWVADGKMVKLNGTYHNSEW